MFNILKFKIAIFLLFISCAISSAALSAEENNASAFPNCGMILVSKHIGNALLLKSGCLIINYKYFMNWRKIKLHT